MSNTISKYILTKKKFITSRGSSRGPTFEASLRQVPPNNGTIDGKIPLEITTDWHRFALFDSHLMTPLLSLCVKKTVKTQGVRRPLVDFGSLIDRITSRRVTSPESIVKAKKNVAKITM